ncbi:MAG: hypothetical protein V1793_25060 [Pseudomonadota bacterium]
MAVDAYIMTQIRQDWLSSPRGHKTRIVQKWADMVGLTAKTLYGMLDTGRQRKSSGRKIEDIEKWTAIVHQIKKKCPEPFGEISTDQALALAIREGLVPDSLAGKIATINRVGRDMGMNQRQRRIQRFQAERPNELHHVDASSSKFLYIHRALSDGDYVLRLHAGTKGYKNKPVPIRLRPWIYGLTDDHSGVFVGRYVAAYGECDLDNLDFLSWAWGQNGDTPFFGIPELIKGDKGPMMKGLKGQDFFSRLGVEKDETMPGNKEAHGKIERPWRTVWQRFEKPFFACSDWKKFEITLSELNARFMNFLAELNDRSHRYEKEVSRIQVWKRISLQGGAVAMPDNALATITRKEERTVGADGCFSLDGTIYEVKGLHNAKVLVYQSVFENGRMSVVDEKTGNKYEVKDFKPNKTGEYTAHPHTPHQKAVAAAEHLELSGAGHYAAKAQAPANVVQLPTLIKETVHLENPLEINTYPSMALAMQDFISICGVVPQKEDREAIQDLIIENGLSRSFVTDLALDVQVEHNRRAFHG